MEKEIQIRKFSKLVLSGGSLSYVYVCITPSFGEELEHKAPHLTFMPVRVMVTYRREPEHEAIGHRHLDRSIAAGAFHPSTTT